jgi:pyruvate/2-oxoglutarate dehydrogenase complex dihydrolipoamide dehydrogenase (E3) component
MTEAGRRVLVVGAGPAGIEAALAAAARGARVTLAERAFVGGNAVAHSLLPSKVLIAAAQDFAAAAAWGTGADAGGPRAIWAASSHLRWRREGARNALAQRLSAAGVRRIAAAARFEAPGRARLTGPEGSGEVAFDAVVIATGSVQDVPPGLVPDGRSALLPRDLASLAALPARAIVVGAGATGVELASMLRLYGAPTVLIGATPAPLPGEDPILAAALVRALAAQGVDLRLGARAVAFEAAGDRGVLVHLADGGRVGPGVVFVATGRHGATADLGVERLGVAVDARGYISVDAATSAAAPGVYAAGDVTGAPLTANKARLQGEAAGAWAAAGEGPASSTEAVPVAVFARPEYARVGVAPGSAAAAGLAILEADDRLSLARHVFGRADADGGGRLRLAVEPVTGRLRGAAILGDRAAERILVAAAAIAWGVDAAALARLAPVVPSSAEGDARLRRAPAGPAG